MKKILSLITISLMATFGLFAQSDLVFTEISYNPITPNNGPEFLEIFNNGTSSIQMEGINIPRSGGQSIRYTFPAYTLPAGAYVLLTNDSVEFTNVWGKTAFEFQGFILNNGLNLRLLDTSGALLDSVQYDNIAPWPLLGAGEGASIELCDANSDNSQAFNWQRSTEYTGKIYNRRKMYGSPGVGNLCKSKPILHLRYRTVEVAESVGSVDVDIFIENSNGLASSTEVKALAGTGDPATDITFTSPTTVSFTGQQDELLNFTFNVVNDTISENDETILFVLQNAVNGVFSNDTIELTILKDPNDASVTKQMKLMGHTDLVNTGAVRLIEVMALDDIADMSIYGIGCANVAGANPGGTDGVEYSFPAVAAKKGQRYYATNDSAGFVAFFGFAPDFVHNPGGGGAVTPFTYNGDDPIELFENGRVIDTYGVLTEDGSGKIWEYTDSWARRKDGTGPDGTIFVPRNWTYGGTDALADSSVNDSCANPYPIPKAPIDTKIEDFNNLVNGNVIVYPNPTNDLVTISGFEDALNVTLMDVFGKELKTQNQVSEQTNFDLSPLNSGMYFIRLTYNDGSIQVIRIIKE